jgi:3-hydroxy-3-methylglutaryl CoA synthase
MMQNHEIPQAEYEAIEALISSTESVVGIDAKKTHIIIIHKLMEIERRLKAIEEKQDQ